MLLIAFSATVHVVHTHGTDASPHPDCALCMVAHPRVAPAPPVVLPVAQEQITEVETLLEESRVLLPAGRPTYKVHIWSGRANVT
jgi:hypothetical protein